MFIVFQLNLLFKILFNFKQLHHSIEYVFCFMLNVSGTTNETKRTEPLHNCGKQFFFFFFFSYCFRNPSSSWIGTQQRTNGQKSFSHFFVSRSELSSRTGLRAVKVRPKMFPLFQQAKPFPTFSYSNSPSFVFVSWKKISFLNFLLLDCWWMALAKLPLSFFLLLLFMAQLDMTLITKKVEDVFIQKVIPSFTC